MITRAGRCISPRMASRVANPVVSNVCGFRSLVSMRKDTVFANTWVICAVQLAAAVVASSCS